MIVDSSHVVQVALQLMKVAYPCFRGCGQVADFLHCFWTCTIAQEYWVDIGSFISSWGMPNIVNPKTCLLGIFGDLSISSHAKRLLHILYFLCEKAPLLWRGLLFPTTSFWLKLVNDSISLYKLTF